MLISADVFIIHHQEKSSKKGAGGGSRVLEESLQMGKRGERLKGIHPFLPMKRKGQLAEGILFCLFICIFFLRVLSCNVLTSEL